MKILLTGSNGFLGRNLKILLTNSKFDVESYSRKNSYLNILKDKIKFDAIIHAASATPINTCDNDILNSNTVIAANLTNLAISSQVKYFINISSVSVYGLPKESLLKEESKPEPNDQYGISKLISENIINESLKNITNVYHFRCPGIVGNGSYEASRNIISFILNRLMSNEEINLYSPESYFNNITSDKTIFNCIINLFSKNIDKGAYLIGSKNPIKFKRIIDILSTSVKSKSIINWCPEPINHKPFILDVNKAIINKLPIHDTLYELINFSKSITKNE